jgi:PAS domain S-box-containing protein
LDAADPHRAWLVAIVEHSADAIISKDLNGIITSWNAGAERLFGYAAQEATGKRITILIPDDRLDEEPAILERIRRGERVDHFDTIRRRKDGSLVEISLTISPLKDDAGRIIGASKIARDITERRQLERRQGLLLSEMNHRIRNTIATVQALAGQTMRGAPAEQRAAFGARLHSLARAHDLLTLERWGRTSVRDVVERALEAFGAEHRDRFKLDGPNEPPLESGKAMMVAMALHELATNAVKYGALSGPAGRVTVEWSALSGPLTGRIGLVWQEFDGPLVSPPERLGFGSRLIELSGGQLDFDPAGIRCRLEVTL